MRLMRAVHLTHDMDAMKMESVRMNDPVAVDALLADLPELLTVDEIAELFRVSNSTVLRWQPEGLKMLTISERVRRVRKSDLRAFLLRDGNPEESDG